MLRYCAKVKVCVFFIAQAGVDATVAASRVTSPLVGMLVGKAVPLCFLRLIFLQSSEFIRARKHMTIFYVLSAQPPAPRPRRAPAAARPAATQRPERE